MSIVDTINDIKLNVENAYTSLENKGATIPNKKNIQNLSSTIESIKSGGGDNPIQNSGGKYLVRVVDYDGTILKEDHLDKGATFTLPNVPTHDRLVFEEWSCPIDIVNNTITVPFHDVIIGPIYRTASGMSEFDITINNGTGLTVTLNMDGYKDWGDGTADELTTHTYSEGGNYTIKCSGTTLTQTGNLGVLGNGTNNINYYLDQVLLSNNITKIPQYCFTYCYNLKAVSLPKTSNAFSTYIFSNCKSLKTFILPNVSSATYINTGILYTCVALENFVIPRNWLFSGTNACYGCYSLKYLYIPNGASEMEAAALNQCYQLKRVRIPSTITSISNSSLSNLHTCEELDFRDCTKVPTLSDSNNISNLSKRCKIIVPANLYSSWKGTTNWTYFANQIYSAG